MPVVGRIVRSAKQIPVYRLSTRRVAVVRARPSRRSPDGECVVVYPEGTITRQPDLWPMTGKTGAARIALASGAPVIPVAQWGANHILAPYAKRPRLLPRKTIHMTAGPPVDLDDLPRAAADPRGAARQATGRIMDDDHPAARGHPRRARPGRAVRPAHRRRTRDRQPARQEGPEQETHMSKVAVFGAGSWGTAFSVVLADAGNDVHAVGPARGAVRDDQREAGEHRLPARHRAPRRRDGDPRPRAGGGRRGGRVFFVAAVADVPRRTSTSGSTSSRATRCWCP